MIRSILLAVLVTGAACCLAEDVKPKVQGYATQRVRERMDRGLVAVRKEAGQVYLGWRLLADDPADIAFNVYRRSGPAAVKLNAEAIRRTTDFVDRSAFAAATTYFLRPLSNGREGPATADVGIQDADHAGCVSIRLQGEYYFQKIGIGDLDGDGRYDFSSYNYASRNQMCVAYLDGKTPCLIVERGTYQDIIVVAYEYHNRRLRELWR
jgi:hypothetical protein